MNCFKKHEAVVCTPFEVLQAPTKNPNAHDFKKKKFFQFTTEDTVESEKLTKLGKLNDINNSYHYEFINFKSFSLFLLTANSELLKRLLQNKHLRDFLAGVDSSENAWKAMKYAMLEPLFIEFADECLTIMESN